MSKKITFSIEQEKDIINEYIKNKKSLAKIGEKYNCSKQIIKRVLIENNIQIRTPKNKMEIEPGSIFKELIVLKRNYEYQKQKNENCSYYDCKCSCGNIITVRGSDLRTEKTKSCNKCYQFYKKDLSGQKIGKLLILKKLQEKNSLYSGYSYLCQCNCGNIKKISVASLDSGTKSCDCLQKEFASQLNTKNLTNQKFGLLTVLEPTNKRSVSGSIIWKCQCECGNYKDVACNELLTKNVQSCGCLKSKGEQKIQKILNDNNIYFIKEKTFENCIFPKTNRKARFDFFLPNYNIVIEYDGKQHFEDTGGYFESFNKIKERDKFKNKWCEENNVILIRIPYWYYDKLELKDLLKNSQFIVKEAN